MDDEGTRGKGRRSGKGKGSRWALVAAFNLFLFLTLAEVLALAGYGFRTGDLYYTNPPRGQTVPERLEGVVTAFRIHPYLGFVLRPPAEGDRPNAYGYDTSVPYPYPRRHDGELLVGLVGGSVAAKLAAFDGRTGELSRALAPLVGRTAGDIRVLNLAQGGFKQPQQLLTYGYFRALGQELDVVVNIDGFNEVTLGARNQQGGLHTAMPSIEQVRPLQEVTPMTDFGAGLETMLEARQAWSAHARLFNRAWSGEAWETRFAAGFMVDWMRYRYHHKRYVKLRLAITGTDDHRRALVTDSWFYLNPDDAEGAGEDGIAWDDVIGVWERANRALRSDVEAAGAVYVHAVQPNQYLPTERTYGDAERTVAFADVSPYAELVPQGYPRMLDRAEALGAHDLTRLFDDLDAPAYEDNCCHYTDAGQAVLAQEIAHLVAESLGTGEAGKDVVPRD
ncbi:MAG: hypothetical protein AAGD06_20715 [Acidobacteriota bacterium]